MTTKIVRKAFAATALLAATGSLYALPPSADSHPNGPPALVTVINVTPEYSAADEASDLLKQIRIRAASLSRDGGTLATFSRSGVSAASHKIYLNYVREHVNRTGEDLARLQEIREDATPMQQQAIDHIFPIAQDIASNTRAAISHVNENATRLMFPEYKDTVRAIADSSIDLHQSVNSFLTAEDLSQKADKLQQEVKQLQMEADQRQAELPGADS